MRKRTGERPRPLGLLLKLCSDGLDVARFFAFPPLPDYELNALPFLQAAITFPRDVGVVDEDITLSAIDRDEAKTFCVVEPLYDTGAERI